MRHAHKGVRSCQDSVMTSKAAGRRALVTLIVLLTAGCSNSSDDTSPTTTAPVKTVKIAVLAPISGPEAATGLGVRNAVELAVRQANEDEKVEGFEVELVVEDANTPEQGAAIAGELAADPELAGVIGPLSSDIAAQVAPVFAAEGVVVISPSATDPTLTRGVSPADAERPFGTFFRMATTDDYQGPFAADFAARDLNAK